MTAPQEQQRSAWRREMEDASVLPPDDPRRQAVEVEVARRGGLARAQWLGLLEEGERWRLELARVDAPDGLEERLLAIPNEMRVRDRVVTFLSRRRALAAAAAVLVGLGVAWVALGPRGTDGTKQAMTEVALLAVNDHLHTHSNDVTADDRHALATALGPHIPFDVVIPDLGGSASPVGGRRCSLKSHPVAFTSWRGMGGRMTLLQLRRSDFGLPADMDPHIVCPETKGVCEHPLEVLFFGRGDTVWVLVADDANDIARVKTELRY